MKTAATFALTGVVVLMLPLILLFGVFFVFTGALAMNAEEPDAAIPPELEAMYHQVGARTGVSWAILAAWDGADNRYVLPVPPVEQIYQDKVREALDAKRRRAEDWCRVHPDDTSRCPPAPPELTEQEQTRLWKDAYAEWRARVNRYIEGHATSATPYLPDFDQDTEAVYRRFLSDDKSARAAELLEGYLLKESMESDSDSALIEPSVPPADWTPVDGFAWPVVAPITSTFGMRVSPIDGQQRLHAGVDLGVVTGTPVRASKAGTVIKAEPNEVFGNMVVVDHGDGYETLYAHNSAFAVTVGQHVEQGQVLSYSGSTGWSTGPHLHFEVHYHSTPIDPLLVLTERSGRD